MKGAFGALGWSPPVFWEATLTEYMAAIEGFNEANGGGNDGAPDDDELAALVERYG